MAKKLAVVVGAGKGMGVNIAKVFGQHDFIVAMLARDLEKLAPLVNEVKTLGIEAYAYAADAANPDSLSDCFAKIQQNHGDVDVLIYNAANLTPGFPTKIGSSDLMQHYQVDVASALHAANLVLPKQIAKGKGAILFTGGGFALYPMAEYTCLSIDKAALRALAFALSQEVKPLGIYVGIVTIMGAIAPNTHFDPADISIKFWELYEQQADVEYIFK
ncbi:MAG: SDR family NAD(P)-dependent oxidoreductase [Desulfovibrionaceae bacterium]|nr:SDR family NAD(P)-dependent oxidoreductase [Desulfovibrionaceae bacterium]